MKSLYNTLIEGLLDMDDQDIDNMSDEAYEHALIDMWEHGFGIYDPGVANKITYNSKKKVVKAKYGFMVDYEDGELVIKHGPNYKYTLDQWTVDGTVSFDCSISIHKNALISGKLKYSMLCHVGKILAFNCYTYKNYDDALKNFFDIRPNKNCIVKFKMCPSNEVMQMPVWSNVAGVEMVYKATKWSNDFDPFEYKDITASRVLINNVGKYFDRPRAKLITDLIDKYDKSGEFYNPISLCANKSIEELIGNNKNTKIFLSCDSLITEYCTLDHTGDINPRTHKEIVQVQTKKVRGSQWHKM